MRSQSQSSVGFFSCRILRLSSIIYSIVLSSMGSRGACLYVHEHDCLGSGMLTMETAVIPRVYLIAFVDFNSSNCDKRSVVSGRILFGIGGRVLSQ